MVEVLDATKDKDAASHPEELKETVSAGALSAHADVPPAKSSPEQGRARNRGPVVHAVVIPGSLLLRSTSWERFTATTWLQRKLHDKARCESPSPTSAAIRTRNRTQVVGSESSPDPGCRGGLNDQTTRPPAAYLARITGELYINGSHMFIGVGAQPGPVYATRRTCRR